MLSKCNNRLKICVTAEANLGLLECKLDNENQLTFFSHSRKSRTEWVKYVRPTNPRNSWSCFLRGLCATPKASRLSRVGSPMKAFRNETDDRRASLAVWLELTQKHLDKKALAKRLGSSAKLAFNEPKMSGELNLFYQ